jgi:hypothetical protein
MAPFPTDGNLLQGKKSPCGRFFGILCAKRSKLIEKSGISGYSVNRHGFPVFGVFVFYIFYLVRPGNFRGDGF